MIESRFARRHESAGLRYCRRSGIARMSQQDAVRAIRRADHLRSLLSCSCICYPARFRPNCGSFASNPKRGEIAKDHADDYIAVVSADPTPTSNHAPNQPQRNIASTPTGLQPPNPIIWRVAAPSGTLREGDRFHCTLHQPDRIQHSRHPWYGHRLHSTSRLRPQL